MAAGNPVVPLVRDLTRVVEAGAGPEAARWVHHGATSQDIMDTASSLVVVRALAPILGDLEAAAGECGRVADRHRATVMAGRTLGQQALPTTFGLKAAGWLVALDEAAAGLDRVRRERLAAQLGGAAGTLASFGPDWHPISVQDQVLQDIANAPNPEAAALAIGRGWSGAGSLAEQFLSAAYDTSPGDTVRPLPGTVTVGPRE